MLKSERAFAGESGEATSAAGALLLARVREDVGRADVSDEVVLVLLGAGGRDEGARGGVCAGEVAAAGLQQPHEPVEGASGNLNFEVGYERGSGARVSENREGQSCAIPSRCLHRSHPLSR